MQDDVDGERPDERTTDPRRCCTRRRALRALASGLAIGLAGCTQRSGGEETRLVEETFLTRARGENLNRPAVWHGDGTHLLFVTARDSHELVAFDATDGEYVGSIGTRGSGPGEFEWPNEVYVVGDLAVVIERDNRRVQVLRLPDGESLGTFGEDRLRRPYGCTIHGDVGGYELYVTDDYEEADTSNLDERVKRYRFTVSGGEVRARYVGTFGATADRGTLSKVESICADPHHDRLLIADEEDYAIKLYDLEGRFVDVVATMPSGHDPEGIALYRSGDGSGYWIATEQAKFPTRSSNLLRTRFHLFDRESLERLATFEGRTTAYTDGVWLSQRAFGPFPDGAFYAIHDDRTVAAFDAGEVIGIADDPSR